MRRPRARIAVVSSALAVALTAGAVGLWHLRTEPRSRRRALDAVPEGALLVARVDLSALRSSPLGAALERPAREIPGVGKVADVCGFDPIDRLGELVLSVPAGGDDGDFGLVAAGDVDDQALVECASKIIEARGGRPVVTTIGSFRSVRDANGGATSGEIAVRPEGPILFGAGSYLRAMLDSADGRTPNLGVSAAHAALATRIGPGAVTLTLVLSPEQRRALELELGRAGGARALRAAGLAVTVGSTVALHAVLACDEAPACGELAASLARAQRERSAELATRLSALGDVLERMRIEADGAEVHVRLSLPVGEAKMLADRLLSSGVARERAESPAPPAARPSAGPEPAGAPAPSTAPGGAK